MKTKSLLLTVALLGGLFSIPAHALTMTAPAKFVVPKFEAPAPVRIVHPIGLPISHKGATVMLTMTVDAAGQPHDIRILSEDTPALQRSLKSAVSQWQFTPARKNGVAVSANVILPLKLEEAGS